MANYIMETLAEGMLSKGERSYPRIIRSKIVGLNEIANMIERNTSFKHSDVTGVLIELIDVMKGILSEGDTARIDGLGTFRPVLGLIDKEERGDWTDAANRQTTARNIKLKGVCFKASNELKQTINMNMNLTRVNQNKTNSETAIATKEARIEAAKKYLSEKGYMRIHDYASLTALPYSTAALELRQIAADEENGITFSGNRASKVYILK